MSLKPLLSDGGFGISNSSSNTSTTVIYSNTDIATSNIVATGNATVGNLSVTGNSLLGAIGNVKITGGIGGQVIQTDGAGNLTFGTSGGFGNLVAPMPTYIATSSSYLVSANFQGLFTYPITIDGEMVIDGVLAQTDAIYNTSNTQIIFTDGSNYVGNTYLTFNKTTSTLSTGNITTTGNVTSGNLITTGLVSASGNIIANSKLLVGLSSSGLTNPVAVFSGSGATYDQVAVINSTGTGSADITAYGNNGDDTQSWTDIGFTGNSFNDANYTVTAAGDGYLFVQGNTSFGGNLIVATGNKGTTKDIVFATGGFQTGNIKARLYNANGTFSVTGNINGGNIIAGGAVSATGNITTTGNIILTGIVTSNGSVNGTGFLVGNGAVNNVALGFNPTAGTAANMAIRDLSTANSTIYFDTTVGSANIGGAFLFRGSNAFTQYARIDQYGVSTPTKPAFRVYGSVSTDISAGTTIRGANGTTIDYNQGSYYDNTTGLFTAPIAGLYTCFATLRVGTNNGLNQASIQKNNNNSGSNVIAFWETDTNTGTATHFSMTSVTKLAVGDTVRLQVITGKVNFDSNDNWGVAFLG